MTFSRMPPPLLRFPGLSAVNSSRYFGDKTEQSCTFMGIGRSLSPLYSVQNHISGLRMTLALSFFKNFFRFNIPLYSWDAARTACQIKTLENSRCGLHSGMDTDAIIF